MKYFLVHQEARNRAIQAVKDAHEGWMVEVKEPTRNLMQNAKFHAICSDIAASGLKWMGKPRTEAQWKTLLVSGHAIATGEDAEVIAGLEGEWVSVRESTARMSKKRTASLIEYALAFAVENGVNLRRSE